MSGQAAEPGSSRRVTGVVLGGLAVGAALGAGVGASPALAAEASAAPATAATAPVDATAHTDPRSFQEQFRAAFTPGALGVLPDSIPIIIHDPCLL